MDRPELVNPTRIPFSFPATPPAKVSTDRKIVRRRSSPCHPHVILVAKRIGSNGTRKPDPHAVSVSGHSTGQGWYRSEARAMPVISMPSLSPESVRKAADRSREKPDQFATILPVSGDATTWVLFPTIPSVFYDQRQPPEELICCWSTIEWFTGLGEINLILMKQSLNKNEWKGLYENLQ